VIELSRMIQELRREIALASKAVEADQPEIRFEVGTIQLEASVQVTVEATAGGKMRFWVLEAGSEVKGAQASVHKVTVPLTPQVKGGSDSGGNRRAPQVSGVAEPGED
jgi:hypothetical protein